MKPRTSSETPSRIAKSRSSAWLPSARTIIAKGVVMPWSGAHARRSSQKLRCGQRRPGQCRWHAQPPVHAAWPTIEESIEARPCRSHSEQSFSSFSSSCWLAPSRLGRTAGHGATPIRSTRHGRDRRARAGRHGAALIAPPPRSTTSRCAVFSATDRQPTAHALTVTTSLLRQDFRSSLLLNQRKTP